MFNLIYQWQCFWINYHRNRKQIHEARLESRVPGLKEILAKENQDLSQNYKKVSSAEVINMAILLSKKTDKK